MFIFMSQINSVHVQYNVVVNDKGRSLKFIILEKQVHQNLFSF